MTQCVKRPSFHRKSMGEAGLTRRTSIRGELEQLRAEILDLRTAAGAAAKPRTDASAADEKPETTLEHQIGELNRMVKTMLDDAETAVIEHPVATVAGAFALGIVIGRLTAH